MPTTRIKDSERAQIRNESLCNVKCVKSNISLDETLRPLWKLTHYCGILLDWCRPICKDNHRFYKVTRLIWITLLFLLLFAIFLFEMIQLVRGIESAPNIHVMILNILWSVPLLVGFIVQEQFIRYRREFLCFFKDWRALEIEIAQLNPDCVMCQSRGMHLTMYAIHAVMTIVGLIALGLDIFNHPEAPYLISTYQIVRETIPPPLICLIHLTPVAFTFIFLIIADLVPSFTYYHAALAVNCLEKNLAKFFSKQLSNDRVLFVKSLANKPLSNQNLNYCKALPETTTFELDGYVHLIWKTYDNIDRMVNRANSLFGTFWVCSQGVILFMITALLYSVFYYLDDALKMRSIDQILPYLLNFIGLTFRLISSTLISSHLHQRTIQFRGTLNRLLNQHWFQLGKPDRELLRSFLSRLSNDHLVASPLDLYNITPSILLSVLGLVVSYVIVLLQSK
ncbi:uncharacterized protein LOC124315327 isoform X2 [Daphnia pulicaria]|uniref:uncharacterized protein LOC124315327 isoform X2 n=1 Tax=Daphnia pulicaria TaxID=35523 RepID=UPI001EEB92EE|nr:uncharacterized protein LOC124315327 isoform X2 [Daphnia pulicaria]